MKIKKKKRYVILVLILLLYFGLLFYFLGYKNVKNKGNTATILVGNETVWNYENKKWFHIKKQATIEKLNWQKFHVYLNQEEIGDYYLWHDDRWYLFDKNKKAVNKSGDLLAIRANYNIAVAAMEEVEMTEDAYVQQVLEEYHLPFPSQYTTRKKLIFDIDNDGIKEEFYILSNAFAIDFYPETAYSFIFMVKEQQITMLYHNIVKNTGTNNCQPDIYSVLDIDRDKKYEMIVACYNYSIETPVYMLYQQQKDQFKILISNQS